ncbi:DNA-binding response OmpR family regulator [Anaerosolibacter carboniphilus]|uniref:Stage 0 sporulation protein A homolog n=1 Tax=Anaerosolibacter carboniphilus TaxID=1417629 RepID=A0A841KUW6_9FIRM|nr:response regulator transcription factor [Anaerosolibacter carboniphilus]MBB6213975.1 DNA-binding response OmpR family regulator [Anaerosolibacter carboniphilus]
MKHKILIVEDEHSIRSLLKVSLLHSDYIIIEAATGEEGLSKARAEEPQVVILDVMLPGMDGFMVCEMLRREFRNIGIIMLTARGQDTDKICGLKFGADDYVIKPFNPTELALRVAALLRRMEGGTKTTESKYIERQPFAIDIVGRKVFKEGRVIEMTPKEYLLMKLFLENPGKAFTRDELMNVVWGWDYIGDTKIVDVNIRRLRTKIEDDSSSPIYIETVWGTGYRWKVEQ